MLPQALAQANKNTSAGADKSRVVKADSSAAKSIKIKIDEHVVSGSLVGHPFNLIKATCSNTSIVLEGGDIIAADPSKGKSKIIIDFSRPQNFANQSYRIRYNGGQAVTADSQTKAPTVTYVTLDKSGALVSTTATNGSTSDNLDYAMQLKFSPLTKNGELKGFIQLQIGTDPVSDVKGYFDANH
jgi:hypothetical protein